MPLYEFRCNKCNQDFEDLIPADARAKCPHCGSADTEKLMSVCVRSGRGGADAYAGDYSGGGGCGSCSGGNCASCGH